MNKIQKISTYLLRVFNLLFFAIPAVIVIQWLFVETKTSDVGSIINFFGLLEKTVYTPEGFVNLSTVPWTFATKILGFSADILSILPFMLSLLVLKSIAKNYQKAEIFSRANALCLKKLGGLFLLNALLIKSLSQTLSVLAVSFTNPPGHRYLTLGFGPPNLEALFFGILLIVFSWVMLEASKLQEDQKYTI